jgi:hypothetical protein
LLSLEVGLLSVVGGPPGERGIASLAGLRRPENVLAVRRFPVLDFARPPATTSRRVNLEAGER